MLELHKDYCIKEIENLKDFITVVFVIIDDIYNKVTPTHIANRCNIKNSIMIDSEIITISIVGELLTIDSEKLGLAFVRKTCEIWSQSSVIEHGLTEHAEIFIQ